jgi:hypothetical protein
MIGDTEAPLQLPFAPKPFRGELFSSWLLRLAGANFVPLDELLSGLQARYPSAPYALSLDVDLDEGFLLSMARFSRISVRTLHRLSLEKQIPFPKATVLLRFNWRGTVNTFYSFEERRAPTSILLITKDLWKETPP